MDNIANAARKRNKVTHLLYCVSLVTRNMCIPESLWEMDSV